MRGWGDVGRHFEKHSAMNQAAEAEYDGRPPRLSIFKCMYPFKLTRSITITLITDLILQPVCNYESSKRREQNIMAGRRGSRSILTGNFEF